MEKIMLSCPETTLLNKDFTQSSQAEQLIFVLRTRLCMFKPSWDPGECRGSERGILRRKENLQNPPNCLKLEQHEWMWSVDGVWSYLEQCTWTNPLCLCLIKAYSDELLAMHQFLPVCSLAPDGLSDWGTAEEFDEPVWGFVKSCEKGPAILTYWPIRELEVYKSFESC